MAVCIICTNLVSDKVLILAVFYFAVGCGQQKISKGYCVRQIAGVVT